jgi:hypothetical protein
VGDLGDLKIFRLEDHIFSKKYRDVVRLMKKIIKQDERDERKLDDIRSSEGKGRKGPASRAPSVPKSRHKRGNSRKESGSADREEETDRDAYPTTPAVPPV